jgi:tRNA pseudouridine13 synthase
MGPCDGTPVPAARGHGLVEQHWHESALAPARAFGAPPVHGRLRTEVEDFQVEEDLGFLPDGEGAHRLLKVEKRGANTEWVARELARRLDCPARDVGYAGLKDRHAVCVQWFSVPAPRAGLPAELSGEGFRLLEAHAHRRKLPRGALAGNRFRILVRDLDGDIAVLRERLGQIAACGVPNYFGPQRFGRAGANLALIARAAATLVTGGDPAAAQPDRAAVALPRRWRHGNAGDGFAISAARSLVFNAVASRRVADGSWQQLLAGDIANLDGRGSVFAVAEVSAELRARCTALALHPTGPLWGRGEPGSGGAVQALEQEVAAAFEAPCALAVAAGVAQERRSLRLPVRELEWELSGGRLRLGFALGRGSFATAVLRELVDVDAAAGGDEV